MGFTGPSIKLEDVLRNREERVSRIKTALSSNSSIISVTVNMMGPVKNCKEARLFFKEGLALLLLNTSFSLLWCDEERVTGPEALVLSPLNSLETKKITMALEDSIPWMRMLDLDVITEDGTMSRSSITKEERPCLVCGKKGKGCASRRLHSLEQMYEVVEKLYNELNNSRRPSNG